MRVTILGSGSWGSALALVLARNGHDVILAGRNESEIGSIRSCRENLHYLPGFAFPSNVTPVTLEQLGEVPEMSVIAVPCQAVEGLLTFCPLGPLTVIASKGLEPRGSGLLSDLIASRVPGTSAVVLSGPNLAVELARGIPTAAVAASESVEAAEKVRTAFQYATYRVYRTSDVKGVELAGALKNVVAICAGASDGLGYGDNTKGALIARGLNEMARLGVAMGARLETFLGIAGVGDLFATGASKLSRNYRVGYALGQGLSLEQAYGTLDGQTAEGVGTCEVAIRLAHKLGVDMPIFEGLHVVMLGRISMRDGVTRLLERNTPEEGLVYPR